jgi:hypothetical protein
LFTIRGSSVEGRDKVESPWQVRELWLISFRSEVIISPLQVVNNFCPKKATQMRMLFAKGASNSGKLNCTDHLRTKVQTEKFHSNFIEALRDLIAANSSVSDAVNRN